MRLPPRSTVDVLTMDGGLLGRLTRADGYSVRMMIDGIEERIARADVLRVDLFDLPGSEAKAVGKTPPGALLRGGAAIGGVAGGKAALLERGPRLIYLAEDLGRMRRY